MNDDYSFKFLAAIIITGVIIAFARPTNNLPAATSPALTHQASGHHADPLTPHAANSSKS